MKTIFALTLLVSFGWPFFSFAAAVENSCNAKLDPEFTAKKVATSDEALAAEKYLSPDERSRFLKLLNARRDFEHLPESLVLFIGERLATPPPSRVEEQNALKERINAHFHRVIGMIGITADQFHAMTAAERVALFEAHADKLAALDSSLEVQEMGAQMAATFPWMHYINAEIVKFVSQGDLADTDISNMLNQDLESTGKFASVIEAFRIFNIPMSAPRFILASYMLDAAPAAAQFSPSQNKDMARTRFEKFLQPYIENPRRAEGIQYTTEFRSVGVGGLYANRPLADWVAAVGKKQAANNVTQILGLAFNHYLGNVSNLYPEQFDEYMERVGYTHPATYRLFSDLYRAITYISTPPERARDQIIRGVKERFKTELRPYFQKIQDGIDRDHKLAHDKMFTAPRDGASHSRSVSHPGPTQKLNPAKRRHREEEVGESGQTVQTHFDLTARPNLSFPQLPSAIEAIEADKNYEVFVMRPMAFGSTIVVSFDAKTLKAIEKMSDRDQRIIMRALGKGYARSNGAGNGFMEEGIKKLVSGDNEWEISAFIEMRITGKLTFTDDRRFHFHFTRVTDHNKL